METPVYRERNDQIKTMTVSAGGRNRGNRKRNKKGAFIYTGPMYLGNRSSLLNSFAEA
jgi:hypothetical protein